MIEQHTAEWLSSLLGLAGSLLLAIPFFADYFAKHKRLKDLQRLKSGVFTPQDAAELRGLVEKNATEKVLGADKKMALCSGAGCALLIVSFIVLLLKAG
jgi:hypothetical protein